MGRSGGNAEELVDEADLACHPRMAQDAVTAADHAQNLEPRMVAGAVFILWKPRADRITRLSAP